MTTITIPPHLFIPALISVLAFILILINRKKIRSKNSSVYYSTIVFLSLYLWIDGSALFDDLYYQWDLNRYDLDQDGIFGYPTETTAEQELAMQRLINDVGRNFAFVTGFIFSAIVSLSLYLILKIYHSIIKTYKTKSI